MSEKERIAKVMARAGLCSRRDAERWIAEGRVAVNGTVLDTPAFTVSTDDTIVVDGKPMPKAETTRLYLFHKPAGLVTTAKDEKGRPTVFEGLPKQLGRMVSVGRLDLNTEGLLLLTNDGELARWLELPANALKRTYRVRAHGRLPANTVERLAKGMTVDGVIYGSIDASIDKDEGTNVWLTLTLTEGKKREIRKVMEALGMTVNRLIRTSYGPFELAKLPRGALEEVNHHQLRKKLSGYFGKGKS